MTRALHTHVGGIHENPIESATQDRCGNCLKLLLACDAHWDPYAEGRSSAARVA
jgi:hypothetical protein